MLVPDTDVLPSPDHSSRLPVSARDAFGDMCDVLEVTRSDSMWLALVSASAATTTPLSLGLIDVRLQAVADEPSSFLCIATTGEA